MATEIATGIVYGISVKNLNQWIFPRNDYIDEVKDFARAHSEGSNQEVRPWLIGAFVSDEAKEACHRKGIRVDSIGAQVVPSKFDPTTDGSQCGGKRMLSEIAKLRAVIGSQPYVTIPQRFRSEHFKEHRFRFDW